ncbi:MAG: hypothetical protein NPIRA02_13420 [Nitrospirales bacterium]|nr:MAG: hypothetical protein NPIRA02_13420 [Nitrospirales bacterium]
MFQRDHDRRLLTIARLFCLGQIDRNLSGGDKRGRRQHDDQKHEHHIHQGNIDMFNYAGGVSIQRKREADSV